MKATYIRQTLDKTLRNQLEKAVSKARMVVEKAAREEIERLGVGESSAPSYLQPADAKLRVQLRAHGRTLGDVKNSDDSQQIDHLVGEVAYEHWHRMLFAYFLVQNKLLMCEGYPVTLEECAELAPELNARNGWEAAGMLAAQMLPQVFRASSPALHIVLPIDAVRQLEKLIVSLHPDTFQAQDALGWLYQFWQSERKQAVNNSGVKIGAEELSPVTQLFTEPYMVSFLLDNALGAWWATRKLTHNELTTTTTEVELRHIASIPGVPLQYLRFVKPNADQPPSANNAWAPAAGTFDQWPQQLSELTVIDPCCGSGHFLVAAFLMLVPLRMADEGLSAKEAVNRVLSQNLHGLELDQRCVELAAFAIALEAWRYPDETGKPLGYRKLPELQLACSGMSLRAAKNEWKDLGTKLAEGTGQKNIAIAIDWMYQTFIDAPVLGSLINPINSNATKIVKWEELNIALVEALQKENQEEYEAGVVAQGLAKAATLLARQYDLVITNVPYLKAGDQCDVLKIFSEEYFPEAKFALETTFVERCHDFLKQGGACCVVTQQYWLFLKYYESLREKYIKNKNLGFIARLGPGAFGSIGGEVVNVCLQITKNDIGSHHVGMDVDNLKKVEEKILGLKNSRVITVEQIQQLSNPDFRISFDLDSSVGQPLSDTCDFGKGSVSGDGFHYLRNYWEFDGFPKGARKWLNSPDHNTMWSGRKELILWDCGPNFQPSLEAGFALRGQRVFDKNGVAIGKAGKFRFTPYNGELFDDNVAVIRPYKTSDISKTYLYCTSGSLQKDIKKLDRKMSVTAGTFTKVRVEYSAWEKAEKDLLPNGLPSPYTNDPTQWIFHGHPCGSVIWDENKKWTAHGELRIDDTVLQVATARLLGYRWPAELDPEMELAEEQRAWVKRCDELLGDLVDDDGIACLPALRGEATAAHRLELMLEAAYGEAWSNSVRNQLLESVGVDSLEVWLRDKFFEQHCKLFQQRPFIWQVWDGVKGGFSALLNYHKLDANNLDRLISPYLNDWIGQQAQNVKDGVDGAQLRLAAAQQLKTELEAIKQGEAAVDGNSGYDIFVRWKPLHEQPIGWQPDLNDGVRLNIRPFMTAKDVGKKGAGILRFKPNIHWKKDRGADVPSAPWYHLGLEYGGKEGDRINDHHLTRAEKQAARDAYAKAQAQAQLEHAHSNNQPADQLTLDGGGRP